MSAVLINLIFVEPFVEILYAAQRNGHVLRVFPLLMKCFLNTDWYVFSFLESTSSMNNGNALPSSSLYITNCDH